ncbi:MAG: hypothetical protein ACI4I5_00395 [Acutalibacteraceae bacterium]
MLRRVFCFLCLAVVLSVSASAVTLDGNIHFRSEYQENTAILQRDDLISNNGVYNAYLYWYNNPVEYSLYLAVRFYCNDFVPDGGKSGVEVTVNDILCTTFYADGTMDDVNPNFFDVESSDFYIQTTEPAHIQNEMRIGIKYGFREDITVGIRILDCSGIPSNYYLQTVYTLPTTAPPEETTAKTTTEKQTKTTTTTTSTTTTTTTQKRTTVPVITAAVGTTAEPVTTKPSVPQTDLPAKTSTTRAKTTKKATTAKHSKTTASASSTEESDTVSSTEAEFDPFAILSETQTTLISPEDVSPYRLYRMKTLGIALAASLVTAAVMISLFLGIGSRKKEKTYSPQEEHQDFG